MVCPVIDQAAWAASKLSREGWFLALLSQPFLTRMGNALRIYIAKKGLRMVFQSFLDAVYLDFADLRDVSRLAHMGVRLIIAALLGGSLGYQREVIGKDAGIRTYMLVSVGAAFFIVVSRLEGMSNSDMSSVLQGLLTGIGFLGGGAILKLTEDKEIQGLTTAAGIWLTAGIGIAVGFGQIGAALLGTLLAFLILSAITFFEGLRMKPHRSD